MFMSDCDVSALTWIKESVSWQNYGSKLFRELSANLDGSVFRNYEVSKSR